MAKIDTTPELITALKDRLAQAEREQELAERSVVRIRDALGLIIPMAGETVNGKSTRVSSRKRKRYTASGGKSLKDQLVAFCQRENNRPMTPADAAHGLMGQIEGYPGDEKKLTKSLGAIMRKGHNDGKDFTRVADGIYKLRTFKDPEG